MTRFWRPGINSSYATETIGITCAVGERKLHASSARSVIDREVPSRQIPLMDS
ncbi:unnamed protein product [Chondrus crispus]|uniref:Uncharacterized protein n=1 Tax=Chondrus crispus TaxID=2769 RepID=R7Q6K7_CHOCR|nr:unnamed protein product [Chondrus crispus]CDF34177.1 unnamed protein product [Chondrus crispus]|eukprot:XP_005713996.1 unnamed protein product [Chondrus crispus]